VNHGHRRFGDPNLRVRNATQSEAASRSARVSKHQKGLNYASLLLSAGVFGLATRSCPFEVPIWRNAQCEAVRRRIPIGPRIQAPNRYHPRRRACQKRESSGFEGPIWRIRNEFTSCASSFGSAHQRSWVRVVSSARGLMRWRRRISAILVLGRWR